MYKSMRTRKQQQQDRQLSYTTMEIRTSEKAQEDFRRKPFAPAGTDSKKQQTNKNQNV